MVVETEDEETAAACVGLETDGFAEAVVAGSA